MPVGSLPDLFGHVGQMPQIWLQFGVDNTILYLDYLAYHCIDGAWLITAKSFHIERRYE